MSLDLISKKTNAVYDIEFDRTLQQIPWLEWTKNERHLFQCRDQFIDTFHQWIISSRLNFVSHLSRFPNRHAILGTTQGFDEAYLRYRNRRLRIFRGEYAYHGRIFSNWKFIEDEPLSEKDWIIVSHPFCSTGKKHELLDGLLDMAAEKNVPVLMDCAYFGTCLDQVFDFSHIAIQEVCFSLTKGLGMGDFRSGVRYSFYQDEYPISQQNRCNHLPMANLRVGIFMMNKFSPDFIPRKYRTAQLNACRKMQIEATPCMHLALGDAGWPDYIIDGTYFRLGIRQLVKWTFYDDCLSPNPIKADFPAQ